MSNSGLFITMGDRDSLKMCLENGVFGSRMSLGSWTVHYKTLADYACVRSGTHVFFFIEKEIIYGGTILGSSKHGSFILIQV